MMAYSELQRRQDALARNRDNHGRMASASVEVSTVGVGTFEFDEPVDFGLTFIDKPRAHYCSEIDTVALRELMGLLPTDPVDLPNCSGAVVDWDVDDNGHYVGAWVSVVVTSFYLTDQLVASHHFDFTGVGLKVIPATAIE